MNDKQDLTTGTISKKLTAYALPSLAANLLQSSYSLMDMLAVGRIVGETGLAAINNASMLSFIINSVCIGVTMGGTVLAARYRGVKDEHGQIEIIGTLLIVAFIAAALVTTAGLAAYRPPLRLLHVPAPVMEDACGYTKIICYGTILVFGYNVAYSIMKGLGDSKSPLHSAAVAVAISLILDPPLVGPFGMGIEGAACVTIFSQRISFVISVFRLKRRDSVFDFRLSHSSIKTDELATILKVGLPTAAQMVSANLSYPLITGMLNQPGVSVTAVSGVGLKINTFAGMPCWAIDQAVTAMAGQNMGADNIKRVQKTTSTGLCLNLLITLIMVLLVQIFGKQLIFLFTSVSPEVFEEGILYLRICCNVNSLVYTVMHIFDSLAIGIGSANIAMFNALLDAGIVRLPVGWLLALPLGPGYPGIYIGQAFSPFLPIAAGLLYLKNKGWKSKRIL